MVLRSNVNPIWKERFVALSCRVEVCVIVTRENQLNENEDNVYCPGAGFAKPGLLIPWVTTM